MPLVISQLATISITKRLGNVPKRVLHAHRASIVCYWEAVKLPRLLQLHYPRYPFTGVGRYIGTVLRTKALDSVT